MVSIRKLSSEGDTTTVCSLAEATKQVQDAQRNGYLVVDETAEEKRIIKNATGLKEDSKLAFFPAVKGG